MPKDHIIFYYRGPRLYLSRLLAIENIDKWNRGVEGRGVLLSAVHLSFRAIQIAVHNLRRALPVDDNIMVMGCASGCIPGCSSK